MSLHDLATLIETVVLPLKVLLVSSICSDTGTIGWTTDAWTSHAFTIQKHGEVAIEKTVLTILDLLEQRLK